MPPPRRAPIPGVTASLADVLEQLEQWERDAGMPGDDQVLDYHVVCIFTGPDKKPSSVPRAHLKPGAAEEWPMPGEYEIRVLDSNNAPLTDAWFARHFDKDSLTRARNPDEGNPMRIVLDMTEDQRIQIRNQRSWIDQAESRERKAKDQLALAEDRVSELTRKLTAADHAKTKAEADRDVAFEQRQEALNAAEQLEEELNTFKAPIAMFVDEGLEKLAQFFGVGVRAANNTQAPSSGTTSSGAPDVAAAGAAATPGTANPNPDPPPPGAEDPMQAVQDLGDLFERCIYDREVLRQMIEAGVLDWELVRRLVWYRMKVDLGPTPKWTEWAAGDAPPAAQQGAA